MKLIVPIVIVFLLLCLNDNVVHSVWITYSDYYEKYGDSVNKAHIVLIGCKDNFTKDPKGKCRELY